MRESFGDLFHGEHPGPVDAVCITTNGATRRDGAAVMGRGCAAQAKRMFPGIDGMLGEAIWLNGNCVQVIVRANIPEERPIRFQVPLVAFPVKHHWQQPADLVLIARSCGELMELADREGWANVLLPRPGCGNGARDWATEVRPLIDPLLDDRVIIVARPDEAPA